MRSIGQLRASLALLLIAAVVAVACGGNDGEDGDAGEAVNRDGVLVFGENLTGSTFSGRLQPDRMTAVCDFHYGNSIYSTLVRRDPDSGAPIPGLARSWEVVDTKTVRFELRPGLTFQDGTALDATAAKAALDKNRTSPSTLTSTLSGIQEIVVNSPTSFTIRLKTDQAAIIPLTLAGREGHLAAAASTDTAPIGAGPFRFVSQQPGTQIILERFDDYWDVKNVALAEVRYVNVGPVTVQGINALRAKEIDITPSNAEVLTAIEGEPGIVIAQRPTGGYYKLAINTSKGPWQNLKFRQAVNHAIDRQAIADTLLGKGAEVAWMPFNKSAEEQYTPELAKRYPYNPDKARQLIRESGLTTPIRVTALVPANIALYQRFSEIVEQQLQAVGVQMQLTPTSQGLQDWTVDKKAETFHTQWSPRPDPSVTIFLQFGPNQIFNTGGFTSPGMDAAIAKIRGSSDPDVQKDGYDEANTIVVDQALEVSIAFINLAYPHRDWVTGTVQVFDSGCQGVDVSRLAVTDAKP